MIMHLTTSQLEKIADATANLRKFPDSLLFQLVNTIEYILNAPNKIRNCCYPWRRHLQYQSVFRPRLWTSTWYAHSVSMTCLFQSHSCRKHITAEDKPAALLSMHWAHPMSAVQLQQASNFAYLRAEPAVVQILHTAAVHVQIIRMHACIRT